MRAIAAFARTMAPSASSMATPSDSNSIRLALGASVTGLLTGFFDDIRAALLEEAVEVLTNDRVALARRVSEVGAVHDLDVAPLQPDQAAVLQALRRLRQPGPLHAEHQRQV